MGYVKGGKKKKKKLGKRNMARGEKSGLTEGKLKIKIKKHKTKAHLTHATE